MASTVQLTHICSKDCSWRDVNFVYRNAVYINNTVNLPFTAVAFREISTTAALTNLLLLATIGIQVTTRSVEATSAGSRTRVQQVLDASSHQPWPWTGLGVTLDNLLCKSGGDALKTGPVTGTFSMPTSYQ